MHLTVFKVPMGNFSTFFFQLSKFDHWSYFPWMGFMHMDCWLPSWSGLLPVWILLSRDLPSVVAQALQVGAGRCLVVFCEVIRGVKREIQALKTACTLSSKCETNTRLIVCFLVKSLNKNKKIQSAKSWESSWCQQTAEVYTMWLKHSWSLMLDRERTVLQES